MYASFAFILSLAASAVAAPAGGRTSAPAGCLTVGASGKYKTVQSAVAALNKSSTKEQCIFIAKGTYKEQVFVDKLASPLAIYGETADTSSYKGNTVTITMGKSQADGLSNDLTATLRAHTPNLKVYNINFVNSKGQGSQAVAVSANDDKQGYYGCQLKGYQDTLLAQQGAQVYAKSYIEGATDFIFGQRAKAWFDGCDIGVLNAKSGYITANGRDSASNVSWYVINKSKVAAAPGNTVAAGAYTLGRPWRTFARVTFQNTDMTNVVSPDGWSLWNNDPKSVAGVQFSEFGNTGAGSKGTRKYGKKAASAVAIGTVLGADYKSWVDATYLS